MKAENLIVLIVFFMTGCTAFSYPFEYETCNLGWRHVHHKHNEASYQEVWCNAHNGIMEYENSDKTRVDCLTDKYAAEFDFADKWHESIGQALHYGIMTGRQPKVVLILEEPKTQMVYFRRLKRIAKRYNFAAEYVTNSILSLNEDKQCRNIECKCRRKDMHHNNFHQSIDFEA